MNALLSFKRTSKNVPTSKPADPLMDSDITLDEGETFSTLKFLDIKREQERQQDDGHTAISASNINASAPQIQSPQSSAIARDVAAKPVGTHPKTVATTATSGANAAADAAKPTRMQVFKDRVSIERSDSLTLPFAGKRSGKAMKLSELHIMSNRLNPIDAVLANSVQPVQITHGKATAQHEDTSEFRLSRSTASLETLLSDFLRNSSADKTLRLQGPDAEAFDYCAGSADLFMVPTAHNPHRFIEEDQTRTLVISTPSRLAIDSLTAAHPLRHRQADEAAFAGWFTEDGFDCDIGTSPIETFVQAETLHLQQQSQRMFKQLRRLSAHLQVQCPQLDPAMALHHAPQADAWMAAHGDTPAPALYRLLECEVMQANGPRPLHSVLANNNDAAIQLSDIRLPAVPFGLLLLRSLARIAASTAVDNTEMETLAVLDVLMRKTDGAGSKTVSPLHALDQKARQNICTQLQKRFASLQSDLQKRGLA